MSVLTRLRIVRLLTCVHRGGDDAQYDDERQRQGDREAQKVEFLHNLNMVVDKLMKAPALWNDDMFQKLRVLFDHVSRNPAKYRRTISPAE